MKPTHTFVVGLFLAVVSPLACDSNGGAGSANEGSGGDGDVGDGDVGDGDIGDGDVGDGDVGDGDVGDGDGGSAVPLPIGVCTNETPLNPIYDSGVFSCDEGFDHRAFAGKCTGDWGAGGEGGAGGTSGFIPVPSDPRDQCVTTADCDEGEWCFRLYNGGLGTWNVCRAACNEDSDCAAGTACECGSRLCVPATCRSDAECGDGFCINSRYSLGAGPNSAGFHCQTPSDECHEQRDCTAPETEVSKVAYCAASEGGPFRCELSGGEVF